MQKVCKWWMLVVLCSSVGVEQSWAQADIQTGSRAAIVVAPLNVQDSVSALARREGRHLSLERIRDTMQTQFRSAINQTRVFNLVERERLDAVLEEQGFQQGMSETPVAMGDMRGAAFLLFLEIDGFQDQVQSRTLGTGRTETLRTIYLSAQARIVDAVSGDTLDDIPTVMIERELFTGQNERFNAGDPGGDRVFVEMATEAANELCQKVIAYLRPGRVLRVSNNEIMINRGTPAGFEVGSIVEAYVVEEIVDEDSGEVFRDEYVAGRARITRANERSSYGEIIDGTIDRQNTVKVIERAPPPPPPAAAPAPAPVYRVPGL
jgi:hypothetical protein